jgi:hypothetical protein
MEINMKTTLILSVLAAMSVASTTSFAQDYVTYSNAYGNAQRTTSATAPYGNAHPTINAVAPALSRFTASEFGFSRRGPQPKRSHTPGR